MLNRCLALSILFHLLLGGLLARYASKTATPPAVVVALTEAQPVEIEFWGSDDAQATPSDEAKRSKRHRPAKPVESKVLPKNLPNIALGDLGLPNPLAAHSQISPPASGAADADNNREGSPYGFQNQITEKNSPLLNYLYRRIDASVVYPSEIYDAWFQGDITATLQFDSAGNWIDDPSAIKAYDLGARYLRIQVLRRLRMALAEPIPENIWKDTPPHFSVEARFLFEIVAPEGVDGAPKGAEFELSIDPSKLSNVDRMGGRRAELGINQLNQRASGRILLFHRSHLASRLAWKLGPFAGYGFMPAVGISPSWFAEKISNWMHHRAKIDPLEKYRDDPEW